MAFCCSICNRYFGQAQALRQHLQDSEFEHPYCYTCNRHFPSVQARSQHMASSHYQGFQCWICPKLLSSEGGLQQVLGLPVMNSDMFIMLPQHQQAKHPKRVRRDRPVRNYRTTASPSDVFDVWHGPGHEVKVPPLEVFVAFISFR